MSLRNRKLVGWKIWYDTGVVLDSRFNIWELCEQKGVQIVKLFYKSDSGIEINIHHNQEYYVLDDLLELPPEIKLGKAIEREKFNSILEKANKDDTIITEMRES